MDSSMVSTPDWAGLQKHLLDIVLEKLNSFSDCVRFSAVCVMWYCVSAENRTKLVKKFDRQVPMLLLPKKGEEKGLVRNLYDVTTNRMIKLEVRVPSSTRYGGSSRGWLISMAEDSITTLINPISPGAVITLPPILRNEMGYNIQIRKAILSADPTIEPNDYIVAAIYGDQGQLAVIKPGGREDARWTFIDKIMTVFDDIIYYDGRLHASDYSNKAYSFDENDIKSSSVPRELSPSPRHIDGKSYLVESLAGELLMVYRNINFSIDDDPHDPPDYRETKNFQVYKWDPSGPIWVKIESLGFQSLFLGDNMSTSIPASYFPGCSPNSIYFTHDFDDILVFGDRGPIDCGVFNIEKSSIIPLFEADEAYRLAMSELPPIWFVPNFLPHEPRIRFGVAKIQNEFQQLKFEEILPTPSQP